MAQDILVAPTPDLRIVYTQSVHAHEDHDTQRSRPLIERLQHEEFMINPPIVAPISSMAYVILDGANRCYAFAELGYPHILVQVAAYESGYVELETWSHIVSHWDAETFIEAVQQIPDIRLTSGQDKNAIAHILFRDGRLLAAQASIQNTHERNAALRKIVHLYQQHARLYRTTTTEPDEIWPLYPEAIALVIFPAYQPPDIIAAAKHQAFLPAGVSRHIVHGRALRINYPIAALRDENTRLEDKNQALQSWLQDRLANRKVRYYAEATYQFDE